jgi:ribosomal protein S5
VTDFALILAGVNAVLTAAPEITNLVNQVKATVDRLFGAGIITREEQDRLKAHCDAHMQARLRGERPPELVIDPDPA